MAEKDKVTVYIGGKAYQVSPEETIITAMEEVGIQLRKGVGCREGYCGACATVYRLPGDYKLQVGLACQTVVEDGMYIAQIPFVPRSKPIYELDKIEPSVVTFQRLYPETFRCVSCNTCSKACPQDIQVMDYVNAVEQGNLEKAADISFDCIRCGLCALRCPAEIVQFNVGILARRLYGRYLAPKSADLEARVKEIDEGKYDKELEELMNMSREELDEKYYAREIEEEK